MTGLVVLTATFVPLRIIKGKICYEYDFIPVSWEAEGSGPCIDGGFACDIWLIPSYVADPVKYEG